MELIHDHWGFPVSFACSLLFCFYPHLQVEGRQLSVLVFRWLLHFKLYWWVDVVSNLFYQRHYPFVVIDSSILSDRSPSSTLVLLSLYLGLIPSGVACVAILIACTYRLFVMMAISFNLVANHEDLGKYPVNFKPIRPPILGKKNGIRDSDVRDAGKKMEAKMEQELGIRTPTPRPSRNWAQTF